MLARLRVKRGMMKFGFCGYSRDQKDVMVREIAASMLERTRGKKGLLAQSFFISQPTLQVNQQPVYAAPAYRE